MKLRFKVEYQANSRARVWSLSIAVLRIIRALPTRVSSYCFRPLINQEQEIRVYCLRVLRLRGKWDCLWGVLELTRNPSDNAQNKCNASMPWIGQQYPRWRRGPSLPVPIRLQRMALPYLHRLAKRIRQILVPDKASPQHRVLSKFTSLGLLQWSVWKATLVRTLHK